MLSFVIYCCNTDVSTLKILLDILISGVLGSQELNLDFGFSVGNAGKVPKKFLQWKRSLQKLKNTI